MKLAWLEDFTALIETGTFSKAAALRHITQPAFSRRIQMLEEWLGVELVNRRSHRYQLTATAARFEPELRHLISRLYELRSQMRADSLAEQRITLTAQHTLVVSYLPRLLRLLQESRRTTSFRVRSGNLEECMAQLTRGDADLLLCFGAEDGSIPVDMPDMESVPVGQERLLPVCARAESGGPLFDPAEGGLFKLLSYPADSFLGQVVRNQCLVEAVRHHSIETVCESAFTVGIKEMCLLGMGIAWLPHGLIERDLANGSLVSLHEKLASPPLTIIICRMSNNRYRALDDVWSLLETAQEQPFREVHADSMPL